MCDGGCTVVRCGGSGEGVRGGSEESGEGAECGGRGRVRDLKGIQPASELSSELRRV